MSQVAIFKSKKVTKNPPKINFLFFVYDSDPTKEHFSGSADITKSYWDFLSIFSDDFFRLVTRFGQK